MKNSNEPTTQVVERKSEEHTDFGFKPKTDLPVEMINEQLKEHQIITDWDEQRLVRDLQSGQQDLNLSLNSNLKKYPQL